MLGSYDDVSFVDVLRWWKIFPSRVISKLMRLYSFLSLDGFDAFDLRISISYLDSRFICCCVIPFSSAIWIEDFNGT